MIGSWRPLKLLKDQKHDTHLFVEVNQATKVWSVRQDCPSGSKVVYFTKNEHF